MSEECKILYKEVHCGMALERRELPRRKYRVRCDGVSAQGRCYKRGPWKRTKKEAKDGACEKGFTYHVQGIVLCPDCRPLAVELSTETAAPPLG